MLAGCGACHHHRPWPRRAEYEYGTGALTGIEAVMGEAGSRGQELGAEGREEEERTPAMGGHANRVSRCCLQSCWRRAAFGHPPRQASYHMEPDTSCGKRRGRGGGLVPSYCLTAWGGADTCVRTPVERGRRCRAASAADGHIALWLSSSSVAEGVGEAACSTRRQRTLDDPRRRRIGADGSTSWRQALRNEAGNSARRKWARGSMKEEERRRPSGRSGRGGRFGKSFGVSLCANVYPADGPGHEEECGGAMRWRCDAANKVLTNARHPARETREGTMEDGVRRSGRNGTGKGDDEQGRNVAMERGMEGAARVREKEGEGGGGAASRRRDEDTDMSGQHQLSPQCTHTVHARWHEEKEETLHGHSIDTHGTPSRPVLACVTRCPGLNIGDRGSGGPGLGTSGRSCSVVDGMANGACGPPRAQPWVHRGRAQGQPTASRGARPADARRLGGRRASPTAEYCKARRCVGGGKRRGEKWDGNDGTAMENDDADVGVRVSRNNGSIGPCPRPLFPSPCAVDPRDDGVKSFRRVKECGEVKSLGSALGSECADPHDRARHSGRACGAIGRRQRGARRLSSTRRRRRRGRREELHRLRRPRGRPAYARMRTCDNWMDDGCQEVMPSPRRRAPAKPIMRIGEATNPGPGGDAERAYWGAFGAQVPQRGGFRDALAPGFGGVGGGAGLQEEHKELFALRMVTVNITSWRSVLPFLRSTTADVLMIQEHKLGREKAEECVAWLRRRGWNALMTPAVLGPNGGWSAGTAILARSHVGMGMPLTGSEIVVPARAVAARLEPPGSRPITVVSAYFYDGVGLGRSNMQMLERIGLFLAAQGEDAAFVIGADYQVEPHELAATAFGQEVGGVLMASGSPAGTCRTPTSARELDYFVVSTGLASGVDAVTLAAGSGIRTHVPVELRFKPRLASLRCLVIRKPPPLSTERIVGPLRQVADWTEAAAQATRLARDAQDDAFEADVLQRRLGTLYKHWTDLAERELVECTVDGQSLPKMGLRGCPPVMVWRSILPERAKTSAAADDELTLWRNAANAAVGMQRITMDLMNAATDDGENQAPGGDGDADADADDWNLDHDAMDTDESYSWTQGDETVEDQVREAYHEARGIWEKMRRDIESGQGQDDTAVRAVCDMVALLSGLAMSGVADESTAAEVLDIRERIGKKLDDVAERNRAYHIAAWTRWLREGIDAGARNAHRYLKVPQLWKPCPARTPDGVVTAELTGMVEAYRDKYVRRWNGGEGGGAEKSRRTDPPWARARRCALPRTNASEIRTASRAFRCDTAIAYDGMAMRHYELISEQGLEVLADLILAMELIGRLPPQLDALVLPMIGKERGGHRAVTTAASLYRLWGRLRREVSQRWEADHDRPYFAAGKGRRVCDAVWRQLAKAEAGDGGGRVSATVLWDMGSFYDSINRVRLWALVGRHDFPLAVARLAFACYDAPRALTLEGRIACPAYARNGVTAGCPFATALTRLYSIDPFDDIAAQISVRGDVGSDFDAYVDDLAVSVTAPANQVVECTVAIAERLRDKVEFDMGCDIETDKAAVVSSCPRVAAAVAKRLGAYAGRASQRAAAVNLGVDYAPGRTRRQQNKAGKRLKRYAVMGRKARKLSGIRRAIGGLKRARRLFTSGLLAAAVPDAAVNGVSDREALTLRRTAAMACCPRARGRSLAMVTILHDLPTWRAEIEVVLQYSRQVWSAANMGHHESARGEFGLTKLAKIWREVDKESIFGEGAPPPAAAAGRGALHGHLHLPHPPPHAADDDVGEPDGIDRAVGRRRRGRRGEGSEQRRAEAVWRTDGRRRKWQAVKGPIGAAILTLHRLGWSMPSPFVVIDDWGEELALTKVTPAMLADLLREATFRALERYVGSQLALGDEEFVGRRACADQVRAQLKSDKSITAEGRAAALSVICNALMTYNRAANSGYLVIDACPLCGARGDTVRHRVWECTHPQVVAARNATAPAWLREEVSRRPRSQTRWTTGLIPHPGDTWPRPILEAIPAADFDGAGRRPVSEEGIPQVHGKLYVDGSCTTHVIPELRRAATALVAMGDEDSTVWRIRMAVPAPMPQSSQAAEFAALPLVQAYLRAADWRFDVASDCMNVVRSCNDPPARAMGGNKKFGGIMKTVRADTQWCRQVAVRKVPAHTNFSAMAPGDARSDAIGNHFADSEAKKALAMHPQPSPAEQQELAAAIRRSRLVVRTIASVLPLFPPMPAEKMKRRPVARTGATIRGEGGHRWVFAAGYWRCEVCWILTVKAEIDPALAHRKCEGPKQSLAVQRIADRGHRMGMAVGQVPVLFCTACGSFSARRVYGLGAACRGTPTRAGAQALARIRRGLQPWQNRAERGQPRPRVGEAAAWAADRARFVRAGEGTRSTRRRIDEERGTEEPSLEARMANAADEDQVMEAEAPVIAEEAGVQRDTGEEEARPFDDYGHDSDYDVFGHGGSLSQSGAQSSGDVWHGARWQQQQQYQGDAMEDDHRGEDAQSRRVEFARLGDDQGAVAVGTVSSAVDARAGPGGTQVADATDAAAPTSMEGAAASVVTTWGAVPLQSHVSTARPPSVRVATLDGAGSMVKRRRTSTSPLATPTRLGAGPSTGLAVVPEVGEGPAMEALARRRDGIDGPDVPSTAAWSGATAAVWDERDKPSEGLLHHATSARQSECLEDRQEGNRASSTREDQEEVQATGGGYPQDVREAQSSSSAQRGDGHRGRGREDDDDRGLRGDARGRRVHRGRGGQGEPGAARLPKRLRVDGGPEEAGPRGPQLHRHGSPPSGRPKGTAGDVESMIGDQEANVAGERGSLARATPRAPVPQQARVGRAARAERQEPLRRRGAGSHLQHRRSVRAANAGGSPSRDAEEWILPWARPPAWLYLPHQAATAGHETVDLALTQAEIDRGGGNLAARGGEASMEDREDLRLRDQGIRGQGPLPGARDPPRASPSASSSVGDASRAASRQQREVAGGQATIRGHERMPGPSEGASGSRAREQQLLDARLAPLAQSIKDHADRVAAKRARTGELPSAPTAAMRIEAIRKRIADRARQPTEEGQQLEYGGGTSAATVSGGVAEGDGSAAAAHVIQDAEAHAASRQAQHGLEDTTAGAVRQLRG